MYMPKPSPPMAMPTRKPLKSLAMAMTNIASPYTIDAVSDEDLPSAGPVGEPATDEGGGDDDDGLGEGAEEDLVRHVGLGAADLVQQVVGLVGGQERVGQDEHEAAGEGPGEVRALARVDVERAGELPQRPGRPVRLASRRSFSVTANSRMKNPPIAHGARNMASWLPVNSWTRKVPLTDAMGRQTPSTPATRPRWAAGTWSGQHRHQGGEQGVEEQLGDAPSDEDDRDVGCQRDHEDADGTADQADDHPGPPHAQPRRGAVAHPAEERVGEHRQQGADPGDQRQAVRRLLDPDERVDLQRQGDQQGREEQQDGADVRQRVQRDETPADPLRPRTPGRPGASPATVAVRRSVEPVGGRQVRLAGGFTTRGTDMGRALRLLHAWPSERRSHPGQDDSQQTIGSTPQAAPPFSWVGPR